MSSYRSPKLTVDGFLLDGKDLLLIKRKHDPYQGS